MNCDDYLSMLATQPVAELNSGRARAHAITCDECDRVTQVIAARERNMLVAYGELQMPATSAQTSAEALRTSRRRKVSLYYRIGLGVSAVAMVLYGVVASVAPDPPRIPTVRETIRLQCLSPEQATEVLRPYLRRTGRITMQSSSALGLIHVEASAKEMATAHKVLDRFDSPLASQCVVRVRVPTTP